MKTTDWKYDFSSLPGWELREKLWDANNDDFYDFPRSDTLCCIYSIREVRMCNPLGYLAVFKGKHDPQLLVNISDRFAFRPRVSASEDGSLLFLQPQIYYKQTNHIATPILILDMQKNRFAFIRTDNYNSCYQVIQQSQKVFVIDADEYQRKNDKRLHALHGKKIRTRFLRWYPLARLSNLPDLL